MIKRLLAVLFLVAPIASARVLSYAPYSDQPAMRGYHERTTRYFALVEADAANVADGLVYQGKVILYDSTGAEAPRVIFPQAGGSTVIRAVALYERDGSSPPTIMVIAGYPGSLTYISRNGGKSWRRIEELDDLSPRIARAADHGGPWTQGLGAPIAIGNDSTPFVAAYQQGIYAISASRPPQLLYAGPIEQNTLLGQNRAGTSFLILTARDTLATVDLSGRSRSAGNADNEPQYGWIADDGSIYTVSEDAVTRYQNRRGEVVASTSREVSFAVPTHDFGGFWFLEHDEEDTTNLSRYTPASGLETMWQDGDAPEIEALHTAADGETLLIQVHRERAKQDLQFLDPALGIWRVGQPAPAGYDELFVIEGPRKGFVHLDVAQAALGEPFVFDSGFVRPPPPDILVSPPPPPGGAGGGGSDVVQEWGVVRATFELRLVIQGVKRDADWTTDLTIYNALDEPQTVAVEYVTSDGRTLKSSIALQPKEIGVHTDFLGEDTSGTLHFLPEGGIHVSARVRHRDSPWSAGYNIPAIDFINAASPRFPVTFAAGAGLVMTDTSGHGIDASVQTFGRAAIVQPVRGSLIAGALTLDDITNDGSYFTPDLPASAIRTVPFIAHVDNADGSQLLTELYLINFAATTRHITIEVKPYDVAQWPRSKTIALLPYESRVISDPLQSLFGLTGMARMRYWSFGAMGDSHGVRVASRAYTVAPGGGTYGTSIPPMNSFQSVTRDEMLEVIGFHSGFRASLGLVDLSPNLRNTAVRVRISIVDELARTLDSWEVTIQPAGGIYLDDLFKSRNLDQPRAARVTVEVLDEWGLVGAYGVMTDPGTKDPTYLGASLVAKPK